MARKRERLDQSPDAEHEYRYLANLGTFHAHRWIGNGGDRESLSDLEIAADLIRRAIELNPDAHFGRERYQLLAIEWLRGLPGEDDPEREDQLRVPSLFDADPKTAGLRARGHAGNRLADSGYGGMRSKGSRA